MDRRVKFKIGQVWQAGKTTRYRLISKTGITFKALRLGTDEVTDFVKVDANDTSPIDTSYWVEVVPRECLCGTNRSVCTYHPPEPWQIVEKN